MKMDMPKAAQKPPHESFELETSKVAESLGTMRNAVEAAHEAVDRCSEDVHSTVSLRWTIVVVFRSSGWMEHSHCILTPLNEDGCTTFSKWIAYTARGSPHCSIRDGMTPGQRVTA